MQNSEPIWNRETVADQLIGQRAATPARIAEMDRNWASKAACKGLDPAIFYPLVDEEADEAKTVCATCPVQASCLEHAIDNRERNGVWGGATERERLRIVRRRRRLRQQEVAAQAS